MYKREGCLLALGKSYFLRHIILPIPNAIVCMLLLPIPRRTDKTFILLYKEMYYRQLMANAKAHQLITVDQRIASFETYKALFDELLST